MKLFRLILAAVIVSVVALAAPSSAPARAQVSLSDVCNSFSSLSGIVASLPGQTSGSVGIPNPGETYTLVVTPTTSKSISIAMVGNGIGAPVLDGPSSAPVTLSYTVPAAGLPAGSIGVGYYVFAGDDGSVLVEASCTAGAVAGCDVLMALPSTSVVGSFVSDALLYAEPGVATAPALTLSAGKTAWVLGKDASGEYYKILWVCDYLWVKVGTMGPDYDAVWQGKPLPTNVVQ
jgi:hypothetical protein